MLLKEIKPLKEQYGHGLPKTVDSGRSERHNPGRADSKGTDYTSGIKKTLTADQDKKLKGNISKIPLQTTRWDIEYETDRGVDRVQDELDVDKTKREHKERTGGGRLTEQFTKGQKVMYKGKPHTVQVPNAKANFIGIVPVGGGKVNLVKTSEVSSTGKKVEPVSKKSTMKMKGEEDEHTSMETKEVKMKPRADNKCPT